MLPSKASEVEPEKGAEDVGCTPPTGTAGLVPALEPSGADSTPHAELAVSLADPALRLPSLVTVEDSEADPPSSAVGKSVPGQLAFELLEIVEVLVWQVEPLAVAESTLSPEP